jgi:hypothetical protein
MAVSDPVFGTWLFGGVVDTSGATSPTAIEYQARAEAVSCTSDSDCESDRCSDGVCCNAACDGACEACNLTSSVGRCSSIVGVPPAGHPKCAGHTICGSAGCVGTCDADSQCEPSYRCFKGVCYPPTAVATCNPADATSVIGPDGVAYPCGGGFLCSNGACPSVCIATADCAPGFVCAVEYGACLTATTSSNNPGCTVDRTHGDAGWEWEAGVAGLVIAGVARTRIRARRARRRSDGAPLRGA